MSGKLYHMGFRGRVARTTMADANEGHDWRIYAEIRASLDRYRPATFYHWIGIWKST